MGELGVGRVVGEVGKPYHEGLDSPSAGDVNALTTRPGGSLAVFTILMTCPACATPSSHSSQFGLNPTAKALRSCGLVTCLRCAVLRIVRV